MEPQLVTLGGCPGRLRTRPRFRPRPGSASDSLRYGAALLAGIGAGPTSYEAAEHSYKELLDPLCVGIFDASAAGAYNSQFSAMAAQPEGRALAWLLVTTVTHTSFISGCYIVVAIQPMQPMSAASLV